MSLKKGNGKYRSFSSTNPSLQELNLGCNVDVVGVNGCSHSIAKCAVYSKPRPKHHLSLPTHSEWMPFSSLAVTSAARLRDVMPHRGRRSQAAPLDCYSSADTWANNTYCFLFEQRLANVAGSVCLWKLLHLMPNIKVLELEIRTIIRVTKNEKESINILILGPSCGHSNIQNRI